MAGKTPPSLAADFSSVLAHLKSRGVVNKNAASDLIQNARAIHGHTYSLILWRFRLVGVPSHGKPFIEEIASDALQILPQILMGYGKTAKLLTRGIVENALRHLYFFDHPIEYDIMNREGKWYLTHDKLIEYAKSHPDIMRSESKFDAVARLASLYSDLSAGIHGRQVRDLEMRKALEKIVYDHRAAIKEAALLRRATEAVNFLLAIFHRQRLRSFQSEDRRIILRSMPKKAREAWQDFD